MRTHGIVRLAAVMVGISGCYSLEPFRGSPTPGMEIALDVNDVGRVALGSSMGPEIDRVQGRLIDRSNGEYLLGVSSVSLLRGGVQTWKGEQVVLKPEFVSNVYERRLDPMKTGAAVAVIGGLVAYVATRGLLGSGNPADDPAGNDSARTRRSPGVHRIPLFSIPLSRIPLPVLGRP